MVNEAVRIRHKKDRTNLQPDGPCRLLAVSEIIHSEGLNLDGAISLLPQISCGSFDRSIARVSALPLQHCFNIFIVTFLLLHLFSQLFVPFSQFHEVFISAAGVDLTIHFLFTFNDDIQIILQFMFWQIKFSRRYFSSAFFTSVQSVNFWNIFRNTSVVQNPLFQRTKVF